MACSSSADKIHCTYRHALFERALNAFQEALFPLKEEAFGCGGRAPLQREPLQSAFHDLQVRQHEIEVNALQFGGGLLRAAKGAENDKQGIHRAERAYPGGFSLLPAESGAGKVQVLHLRGDAQLGREQCAERFEARVGKAYGGEGWIQAVGLLADVPTASPARALKTVVLPENGSPTMPICIRAPRGSQRVLEACAATMLRPCNTSARRR